MKMEMETALTYISGRLCLPEGYTPALSLRETEQAIKFIKDTFQSGLAAALNLARVSAPLCVTAASGLNDRSVCAPGGGPACRRARHAPGMRRRI